MNNKIILCTLALLISFNSFAQNQNPPFAADQLIINFRPDFLTQIQLDKTRNTFDIPAIDALNQSNDLREITLIGNKKLKDTYVLRFKDARDILQLVEAYEASGVLTFAEPNFIGQGGGVKGLQATIPDDPLFSRQWGLVNDGSFSLSPAIADADIDMEEAWDIEQGKSSIIVAVLDSGFKLDHSEFNGRIWNNSGESSNGTDSDNNNYVDDVQGWDFVNQDNNPTDDHGHGTNVAGIIGSNGDNGSGYAGVDWNCKMMIGKILDQNNSGFYSWWIDAIYYAVDNGANVINMSVGGSGFSSGMETAVNYAYQNNVSIVVSMMNFDNDVPYYPAAYDNTIAVGSTNPNDNRTSPFFWSSTSGSNYGSHIDVVAPGNYIYGLNHNSNTNFNSYWGGTSQAAPLVAGLASLLLAQDPNRSPDDIRSIITSTAEDEVSSNTSEDTPGWDEYFGWGRINAFAALEDFSVTTREIQESGFSIYPNPLSAKEKLVIEWEEENPENKQLTIYNTLGQIIHQEQVAPYQLQTMITLPEGSLGYFLLQIQKGHNIISKPFLISQ